MVDAILEHLAAANLRRRFWNGHVKCCVDGNGSRYGKLSVILGFDLPLGIFAVLFSDGISVAFARKSWCGIWNGNTCDFNK